MAGLMMLPTQDGLNLISEDIKSNLKYAVLLDESKKEISRYEFNSIYYDNNKVLTALFEIPISENLTTAMCFMQVVNGDGAVISEAQTPLITFVTGVGGTQTIKFAVSGEAGEVVFKANDYITQVEFEELYMPVVVTLTNRVTKLENKLLEKGVIDG